ncbi:MAG TPA: site-2 protease family protein [Streptosporangiaceae bacterium]|nr:site-2 protease family protein [Streptosporangiaceae bacterium]
MKQTIRLGRIAGIPIGMHWTVLVIVALITDILAVSVLPAVIPRQSVGLYWTVAIAGSILFVVALAAHEIAHAVVARRYGIKVRSITLWMLGGVAQLEGNPPTAKADVLIAVAGPATSLAAGVVFGGAAVLAHSVHSPAVFTAVLSWLALMNGILAVFNLLPGAPLDGGRILRGLLWMRYGDRQRASQAATRAGQVLGVALGMVGLLELLAWRDLGGLWLVLIGWFVVAMARTEQQSDLIRGVLAGMSVRDVMLAHPDVGAAWSNVADFTERIVIAPGRTGQTVFPVVGFDGDLVGVVFAEGLVRVPPADRPTIRLSQVATPVPPDYVAAPDAAADSVLARSPLRGQLLAVVVQDRQIVGIVTTDELRQAMLRAQLHAGRPAGNAQLLR